jgi:hypothetical protein
MSPCQAASRIVWGGRHTGDTGHGCAIQDFVRLASWEDRGYYAMRASTEKAQRQLHRLTRNATEVHWQSFGCKATSTRP